MLPACVPPSSPAAPHVRRPSIVRAALVSLLTLASLLITAIGLMAAGSMPQRAEHVSVVHHGALSGATSATVMYSANWSGYASTQRGTTAVSGTWNVPSVRASRRATYSSVWVGIGGLTSGDLIQAGTESDFSGGHAIYYAWIEALPAETVTVTRLPIHPGNIVSASITYRGGSRWMVTLRNLTTGRAYARILRYRSSFSSAEWIEEAPLRGSSVLPLASSSALRFRNVHFTVRGRVSTLAGHHLARLLLVDSGGYVELTPSVLSRAGAAFTIWRD